MGEEMLNGSIKESWKMRGCWTPRRVTMYVGGCVLFSLGVKMFIDAALGTDPLHAMILGIVKTVSRTFIGVGVIESAVTIGFLLIWMFWNRRLPPLMTFITMAAVGFLVDFWNLLELQRITTAWLPPVALMIAALLIDSYASALIIMSGIGIRVMDLLAITIVRRFGWEFLWAKLLFEASFICLALLFDGPVGWGTIGFVPIVGTMIPPMMWANGRYFRLPNHGLPQLSAEPV
jgi:uncharacterized protein